MKSKSFKLGDLVAYFRLLAKVMGGNNSWAYINQFNDSISERDRNYFQIIE